MPMVKHCLGSKGLPHKPHDGRFSSCNSPSSSAKVKAETTGVLAEIYGILESSTHTVFNLQHESKSQLNHEALLLLDVACTQCEVFHAEQALVACITHKYKLMAKLYNYKAGSGKARVHKKDMEVGSLHVTMKKCRLGEPIFNIGVLASELQPSLKSDDLDKHSY
ncbi:hypothetical protein F5J12DRAFT_785481 [Pisolithus orientalis]|uniref:uncharacterized protein n=1 Tax=Pisolithus orientalis TaxID=936130 RepID=UPI0022243B3E|nr:uncharacterized protein F5J12DRAFT_786948 [Pisolithus orientalis]XP_051596474.1 uncharacterized protein F5J12DRAFT_785481 [Pisolithus orientalis]KAI5988116.1 hypothetical protein F5J12DRAFT_786948 [Pisolithus orientalis]KAI5995976.1 hypothetical protein F5J12DRAFT_785481 [Pisolithus orientalis]